MSATLLATHRVEKPWGRTRLWPGFPDPAPGGLPIGEIWFQAPDAPGAGDAGGPELLVKYLFTSEKLSVQVHPDDAAAQARGLPRGKDECWVILAAEPDATIALGTRAPVSRDALRRAAQDGSIEEMLDWKPVMAGDFFYSASGTVHAIGAGITLVEIQQNSDTTYRLYDYGRPRALHLDEAVAVADPVPFVAPPAPGRVADDRMILVEGPKFVLERWGGGARTVTLPDGATGWFVPLTGEGTADGIGWRAGQCLTFAGETHVSASADSDLLFAYPGAAPA